MKTNWRLTDREVLIIAKALQEMGGTNYLNDDCVCNVVKNEEVADLAARFASAACSKKDCDCEPKSFCSCRDCC